MSSPADIASAKADLTAVPSAPFIRRAIALIADLLILAVIGIVSVWRLGLGLLDGYSDVVELMLAWGFIAVVPTMVVATVVVDAARIGQTPGMAALGIRVVHDGASRRTVNTSDPRLPLPSVPAMWRDVRVLRVVGQVLSLVVVIVVVRWLFSNLVTNMDDQGVPRDFDFLQKPYSVDIRDSGFNSRNPVWKAVLVGVQNTALAAVVGVLLAAIVGLIVGIARLSSNYLVAKLAAFYVQSIRNIPPLVIIIFFLFALFTYGPFPQFTASVSPWQGKWPGSDSNYLIASKDRWGIPSLAENGNVGWFWLLALSGLILAAGVWQWRTHYSASSGEPHRRMLWSVGALMVVLAASFIALGGPYRWSWPAVSDSGRTIEGGFATNAGYLSISLALGLYTASHVAEIVRGSILAVPRGQTEAANAIGLSATQKYRHVLLPQAARVSIPPFINQCLNLTKNTSLGIAVGYPEIVRLTDSSIGNGNPAPQSIVVLMGVFLSFSLLISLVLNLYNRSIQLTDR